jgi:hypothetical protein
LYELRLRVRVEYHRDRRAALIDEAINPRIARKPAMFPGRGFQHAG